MNIKKQPSCKIEKTELINHGHTRIDDYFWMNKRDSKDVLNYISEENKNTEDYFTVLNPLKNILLDEFEARINGPFKNVNYKKNIEFICIRKGTR